MIGPKSGYLRWQRPHGRAFLPLFKAWPDGGSGCLEEPACNVLYQAYEPVRLDFLTTLVSQAVLNVLLGRDNRSFS